MKKIIIALILTISTLIVARDLLKPGYFSMHDDLQVGRLYQMDLCFQDGQIPCRWVPDMGYGYGYPLFNYYPPLPYYLGEFIHSLGLSFIDSAKVLFFWGFLVSGLLMFVFTRRLWGDWGGLLSAVLYLFAPYHAVDVYVRGALNEFWALAFLPGLAWAADELVGSSEKRWAALFALFLALLLLSHNLMALIFTPAVAGLVLLRARQVKIPLGRLLGRFFLAGVWGLGLAAFFTLPVVFESRFVHLETMLLGYFNYLAHYVPIGHLLFTRYWGYGSSGWMQETGMPFQVGLPHWPLVVVAGLVASYLFFQKKVDKWSLVLIAYFVLLSCFSLFLVHPRSVVIWQLFDPLLKYMQFPWRFLTLVIFTSAVTGGGLMYLLGKITNHKYLPIISILLIVTTVGLNYQFFRAEKILTITDQEKLFSAKGWNKLQTDAIFDYLPISATAPPAGPAPAQPKAIEGEAVIGQVARGTSWYKFKVNGDTQTEIEVPVYYFPGWQVQIDQQETAIVHDNYLGLITVKVPEGEHAVELGLRNTPVRTFANLLSFASWLILLGWLAAGLIKRWK